MWTLRQGDVLRMHLDSQLDFARGEITPPRGGGISCRGANLHTHGLLVSPYKRTDAEGHVIYGDYVLDVAVPDAGAEGDPCGGTGSGP